MIDRLLNSITMFRLLAYGLGFLLIYSLILAFLGVLPYGGWPYVYSAGLLLFSCYLSNLIFSKLFRMPANVESFLITALILYFILLPAISQKTALILLVAGVVAMASKYVLNLRGSHIFNPAALAAVALNLAGSDSVIWWVSYASMLPAVLILGLIILRKVRKFTMFTVFILVSVITMLLFGTVTLKEPLMAFTSWPLIFFGSIMLTEPLTMPARKHYQLLYAGLIALLAAGPFKLFGLFYNTPELALVIGNFLVWLIDSKKRLRLVLKNKREIARDAYEFSFAATGDASLRYLPGQYLDWTLKSGGDDSRGNRRYFTIASSPIEKAIQIGVKCNKNGSTFKQKLLALAVGNKILAGGLAGDFVMPKDKNKKLAFIAGGIGVTPFRSMIKYLLDRDEKRDIVFFYTVRTPDEIAYRDIFDQAREIGLRVIYLSTEKDGYINQELILKEARDFKERVWYLSGPSAMVESYKKLLRKMAVKGKNIVMDYFPGF